jgi:predicted  nucleic acid-binding Zn-ribbon protein
MQHSREEYVAKVKLQLDDLNAKVDLLEAKMAEAKAEVRASYRSELAKLRHQSDMAGDKLAEMKATGEDTWDKMLLEMDKARDAFMHSLNYFKSQF